MPSNSAALVGISRYSVLVDIPGAAGHALHTGRGIAVRCELAARDLIDEPAGFLIGPDLRAAPAAPVLGGIDLSHAFT